MILKPCQSLHIKFWFFSGHFNIGQPRFVKKFDTIWAMDVGVPCLNLANCPWPHFGWIKAWTHPFTDLVSVKFQISWLIWLCLCPNDQKKKRIWPASFYCGSESLKPSQICTGISVKGAISENCFGHSEAKWSPINEFLTFSGHLDTGLAAWSKKFEICHSLSLEGGGPKPRNQPIHTPHFGELYAWSRALMAISVTQYGYWLFICSRLNHQ